MKIVVLYGLGLLGLVIYLGFVILLGFGPLKQGNKFYEYMSFLTTTISAALATFVGAVLGLDQVNRSTTSTTLAAFAKVNRFQYIATGVYFLTLAFAAGLWGWRAYNGDDCDPTIKELGKSLGGLIVGAVAVMLKTS